jgi:hypothetical protein
MAKLSGSGICSDLETFEQRAVELTRYFVSRGHDTNHTLEAVDRARNIERSEALKYKSKGALFRVPFVTTYYPKLPHIGTILRKHWHFIENHCYLNSLFPEYPVIAFRRPRNLRDLLVNAIVPQSIATDRLDTTDAIAKCKRKNCDTCPRFPANRITNVTSHTTGHT